MPIYDKQNNKFHMSGLDIWSYLNGIKRAVNSPLIKPEEVYKNAKQIIGRLMPNVRR